MVSRSFVLLLYLSYVAASVIPRGYHLDLYPYPGDGVFKVIMYLNFFKRMQVPEAEGTRKSIRYKRTGCCMLSSGSKRSPSQLGRRKESLQTFTFAKWWLHFHTQHFKLYYFVKPKTSIGYSHCSL